MTTIIGIAGSLRQGSFNASLLRAAAELAPGDTRVDSGDIREFPLYDGDLERTEGIPEPVRALKDAIAAADGLLLVTPEYNHGIPGVFKNAIDWLSRPPKDISRVFGDKPVAVMGATPGRGGTRMAQLAWLPILHALGTRPWFGQQLYVDRAGHLFDDEGELVDASMRDRLRSFMEGFAGFARRSPSA
jgi:chromate reductase, NAD(P)H dehydrogenase (quinone)